jgi:hypothetical protein
MYHSLTFRCSFSISMMLSSGSFEVEDEQVNPTDFSATITELPKGHIVYQAPKRTLEGSFKVESNTQASRYSICFHNNARSDDEDGDIEVGFSIRVSNPIRAMDVGEIGPDTEKALKLVEKAAEIHEDWAVMLDHLDFAHNREAVYEDLAKGILSRLAKWTYIEAFLVMGMATGQVMYWRKFFETRRYL